LLCVTPAPAIDRTARVARLSFDTILRPSEVVALAGGKGVNVARAAHRLGARVTTTGLAGGHAGRWLLEQLRAEGLDPSFVETASETRTTYVTVDDDGRSVIVYEPHPPVTAADFDRLLERLNDLLRTTERVVVSGSLPPGSPADGYARVVRVCHESGRPCLVDVGGDALRSALEAAPDVVKVSLDEAVAAGFTGDAPSLTEALARAGAGLAVVTDGARGASATSGRTTWLVPTPPVTAINAVGSGDAFSAGLTVALLEGADVEAALALGSASGAANAETLVAGTLDPDRARALAAQIRVRVVKRE
jgi:1-phosphofructokinase family hexose kinase